ncbi:hypothetical protein RDI58_028880 [Solanum bulbocastanum]|uniref:Uncharacterized protein n=1 Tax=Solanum bulbocastanum TaxID=147425 RepID=A0AAN8SVS7_SOLBU
MGIVEVYFCHMADQVDLLKVQSFAAAEPDTIAPTQALTIASTGLVGVELTQPATNTTAAPVETEFVVADDDNPVLDFD